MMPNKSSKVSDKSKLYTTLANRNRNIRDSKQNVLKGNFEILDEEDKYHYEAMQELEELGFPVYMESTSFFADIVGYTKSIIDKNKNTKEGLKKIKELLQEIETPYSNYHLYVSRELNDMGCKSFHEAIKFLLLNMQEKDKENPIANCFDGDLDADDKTCQVEIGKLAFAIASSMSVKEKDCNITESIKNKVRMYSKNDY